MSMSSCARSLQALPRAAGMGDQAKLQQLVAHPAFVKLRATCTEVDELKTARSKLEEDANLKARAEDLQAKFVASLKRGARSHSFLKSIISFTAIIFLFYPLVYEYMYIIINLQCYNENNNT